jgi:hypothetical protein
MKKYMQPTIDIVEMETGDVMVDSGDSSSTFNMYEDGNSLQLEGRKRGEAWSEYEGR